MKPDSQKTDEHPSRSTRPNPKQPPSKPKPIISDGEALKILEETERLLANNDTLETINLLRALRDNMGGVKSQQLQVITLVNLGVLYYQVGFLEEAQAELAEAANRYAGKEVGRRWASQAEGAERQNDALPQQGHGPAAARNHARTHPAPTLHPALITRQVPRS